jgi:hypothetical protein
MNIRNKQRNPNRASCDKNLPNKLDFSFDPDQLLLHLGFNILLVHCDPLFVSALPLPIDHGEDSSYHRSPDRNGRKPPVTAPSKGVTILFFH